MRVLITGVAGFIGSTLADRLVAEHQVFGMDNLSTGRRENVNPDVEWFDDERGDIAASDAIFAPADLVIHCAASYKDGEAWAEDVYTNVLGTTNVIRHAQKCGARLLYFQTALCYGHNPADIVEVTTFGGTKREYLRSSAPLSVNTPIAPDNSYAITKTAAEQFIQHSGIPYVSLRLANVYGPRNLSGPIPTFFKRITEGKTCTVSDARRDYVYIDDLMEVAIPAALGRGSGVYHVSSGTDFEIADAFTAVAEAMGAENVQVEYAPRQPGDASSILLDPRATEDEFGWKASTPFADGIAKAVEWYSEHGVGQTFTHLAYAD